MERTQLLRAASAAAALVITAGTAAASAAALPRDHVVLKNAIAVDATAGTVTLPLHRGTAAGKPVWYIVTDSSDKADAARRGAVYSPLIARVGDGCAACLHTATEKGDELTGPGGKPVGPVGFVVNCPVVAYVDSAP